MKGLLTINPSGMIAGIAGLISVPASLGPLSDMLLRVGLSPIAVGCTATAIGLALAVGMYRVTQLRRKATKLESMEHDLVHNFRNHATEVSVLSQKGKLSRDQFDNSLDHALQGAAETLTAIFDLKTGQPCGVALHLIDDKNGIPFVARDRRSFKLRTMQRSKDRSLSSGMREILDGDPREMPVRFFPDIRKSQQTYEDTDVENPEKLFGSVYVIGIQSRIADIIRERHRDVFPQKTRLVGGFLTVESKSQAALNGIPFETYAKYADLIYLGLAVFASAEVQQFGLDNSTIGTLAIEMFNNNVITDVKF